MGCCNASGNTDEFKVPLGTESMALRAASFATIDMLEFQQPIIVATSLLLHTA